MVVLDTAGPDIAHERFPSFMVERKDRAVGILGVPQVDQLGSDSDQDAVLATATCALPPAQVGSVVLGHLHSIRSGPCRRGARISICATSHREALNADYK